MDQETQLIFLDFQNGRKIANFLQKNSRFFLVKHLMKYFKLLSSKYKMEAENKMAMNFSYFS
jgi:hypothetical protein